MKLRHDQATAASRWILYHGASSYRLPQSHCDNRLNLSQTGEPKLSLTPERSVAEYFACKAVTEDLYDHPREESEPVLLALDGEGLVASCMTSKITPVTARNVTGKTKLPAACYRPSRRGADRR